MSAAELLTGAAKRGDIRETLSLLHNADTQGVKQEWLDATDETGMTGVMWATRYGRIEILRILLQQGANPDTRDKRGWTALMWAVYDGRTYISDSLLKAGADPLLKNKDGKCCLMVAAILGRNEIVELLLNANADPHALDSQGLSTLMMTACYGTEDTLRILLDWRGANPCHKDEHGWTALMWAARYGRCEIATLLLNAGANVYATDSCGWTALFWAVRYGRFEMVQSLLEAGAEVRVQDYKGNTAMHYATSESIRMLLRESFIKDKTLLLLERKALGTLEEFVRDVGKDSDQCCTFYELISSILWDRPALVDNVYRSFREDLCDTVQDFLGRPRYRNRVFLEQKLRLSSEVCDRVEKSLKIKDSLLLNAKTARWVDQWRGDGRSISLEDVVLEREIGRGAFGVVYKAQYAFQIVAVKHYNEAIQSEAKHELEVMQRLNHECLVRLFGWVAEKTTGSPKMIVMEYGSGGSLFQYLQGDSSISWQLRLHISGELSRGLAYLHRMGIIHGDIKSSNAVLTTDFRVKWCDFGLAKKTAGDSCLQQNWNDSKSNKLHGTLRWMAPETLKYHKDPNRRSDIWALGMVFFEVASRRVPYASAMDKTQIVSLIKEGRGEKVPEECWQECPFLARLMRSCWMEGCDRPTAACIVHMFGLVDCN